MLFDIARDPHEIDDLAAIEPAKVAEAASPHPTVVQQKQLGTAHAVLAAEAGLVVAVAAAK